jgi:hypothetical protein
VCCNTALSYAAVPHHNWTPPHPLLHCIYLTAATSLCLTHFQCTHEQSPRNSAHFISTSPRLNFPNLVFCSLSLACAMDENLDIFPLFSLLPKELQLSIWKYAVPPPRIIEYVDNFNISCFLKYCFRSAESRYTDHRSSQVRMELQGQFDCISNTCSRSFTRLSRCSICA